MANFNTHLVTAATFSGVAATTLYAMDILTPQDVLLNFTLGSFSGLLPDVDSDNSVVLRVMFGLIAVLAAFLGVFNLSGGMAIAEILLIWLGFFLVIYLAGFSIFKRFTTHRGIFHSIPAAIFFGCLTIILVSKLLYFSALYAWVCGFFVFCGYIIHLLLDEIFSVDLSNQRIKRSFGSAIKLWEAGNMPGTVLLYSFILIGALLMPSPGEFIGAILNSNFIRAVQDRFMPSGGWFLQFR